MVGSRHNAGVAPQGTNRRVVNGLLALSSAAVLSVYAAGYERTRAAADRFALQADARREHLDPPPAPVRETGPGTSAQPDVRPARTGVDSTGTKERRKVRKPRPNSTPTQVAAGPGAPTPLAPEAPLAPPAPPAVEAPRYRDGTYLGWGTSRHGDIQAAVVIENGRIASATIAQCLTRYSCSVIAKLPPQVAERQSPEVDYVSGATQSTNAFYYAVVEALGQAKAK